MRFNLRRKPDDRPEHGDGDSCSDPRSARSAHGRRAADPEGVDLDEWVQLGADALASSPAVTDHSEVVTNGSTLRERLLAVLAQEDASLVPPSAGDMTQAEWDSLTELEREGYRRDQLKQLDPRLVPSYTLGVSRSGSRSARVYR